MTQFTITNQVLTDGENVFIGDTLNHIKITNKGVVTVVGIASLPIATWIRNASFVTF